MTLTDALKHIEVLEREVEQWKTDADQWRSAYRKAICHDHRVITQLQTHKSLDRAIEKA